MPSWLKSALAVADLCTLAALAAVPLFELVDDHRFEPRLLEALNHLGSEPALAFTATPVRYAPHESFTDVEINSTPVQRVATERVSDYRDQCRMRSKGPISTYPHATTVALMGDSFSFGAEVEYDSTLQGRLEARFSDINIANFGEPGQNSRYFGAIARRDLACTGLTLVNAAVVGLYTDMRVGDLPRQIANERFGDWVVLDGLPVSRFVYDKVTASAWRHTLFKADLALRQWSAAYNLLFPFHRQPTNEEFAVDLRSDLRPELFQGWIDRILRNLRDVTEAKGLPPSKVVIWYAPSNQELTALWLALQKQKKPSSAVGAAWQQLEAQVKALWRRTFLKVPPPDHVEAARAFWQLAAASFTQAGYTVVDPRRQIDDLFWSGGTYPYSGSGHFRPEAYAVAADALEPALRKVLDRSKTPVQIAPKGPAANDAGRAGTVERGTTLAR